MKRAFTLVEVLVVVIVLGILATIALPQFLKMGRRARLAEAWAGLGALKTAEGVYYLENDSYVGGIATAVLDFNAPSANFVYSVDSPAAGIFTAYATGDAAVPEFAGLTAWIDNTGAKGSSGI